MRRRLAFIVLVILTLSAATTASAQLIAAKDSPIVYGHYHVATSDLEAHKKFWVGALGGTLQKFGANHTDIVKFPNVLIFFRNQ